MVSFSQWFHHSKLGDLTPPTSDSWLFSCSRLCSSALAALPRARWDFFGGKMRGNQWGTHGTPMGFFLQKNGEEFGEEFGVASDFFRSIPGFFSVWYDMVEGLKPFLQVFIEALPQLVCSINRIQNHTSQILSRSKNEAITLQPRVHHNFKLFPHCTQLINKIHIGACPPFLDKPNQSHWPDRASGVDIFKGRFVALRSSWSARMCKEIDFHQTHPKDLA